VILTSLLKEVSRSFYLTLRVLPRAIRPQISLAYLLARTTDTIADTVIISLEQRLRSLADLREHILGRDRTPLDFGELARHQGPPAERVLLEHCEETLAILDQFGSADRELIRQVLGIIISGQELDLRRFAGAAETQVISLTTQPELEDYTYRVAGCVGEFWTKMCRARLFPRAAVDDRFLLENGVRFGKGLQLVNILRDLPEDLRQGRCYLPADSLATAGLAPAELLEPKNEGKFRPIYNQYLAQAEAHLTAGWAYTNALPRSCARVRLACAWPILIGMKTIAKLRVGNILAAGQPIKISRSEVKNLLLQSVLYYPFPSVWRSLLPAPGQGMESCCVPKSF
ncbi:MAG TPA: phytoene/squalene synthase family protein, partial [Verrucomicrobiae bacterium]|nr:phytoene/squalene synthase family protein [Verrucomicrobiae bacterium]